MKKINILSIIFSLLILSCRTEARALDLSTPSSALITCRRAFYDENYPVLEKCLSERLKKDLKRDGPTYIRRWKSCFETCGGWDRKIVEVRKEQKFAGIANTYLDHRFGGTESAPNNVYVYLKPVGGCQDYIKMIKENDEWKFDER